MMLRREFMKRMAFAALATWFLDVPLSEPEPVVSSFSGISERRRTNGGATTIVGHADVYVSDFGPMRILPGDTEEVLRARALRQFIVGEIPE